MYWCVGSITLILVAAALLADEPARALPPPRALTAPVPEKPARGSGLFPGPALPAEVPSLTREMERLRKEREALRQERDQTAAQTRETAGSVDTDTSRLRLRLAELLLKLSTREKAAPAPAAEPAPATPPAGEAPGPSAPPAAGPAESKPPAQEPPGPVDPHALADSLYRAGDYEVALATYRLLEAQDPPRQEQIYLQYMIACCLRQLGKLDDALAMLREVASAGTDDPVLANAAQWQIGGIRWRRDLENQLQQLRQRRLAVEGQR